MHASLRSQAILIRIIQLSDRSTRASCARVCKVWSSIALSLLWDTLSSMKPLLSLLGPVKSGSKYYQRSSIIEYEFKNPYSVFSEDWERLEHYAPKVRALLLNATTSLNRSTFLELAIRRPCPSQSLLPNLRWLRVCGIGITYAPLFLGDKITSITIDHGLNTSPGSFSYLCDELIHRASNVSYLEVTSQSPLQQTAITAQLGEILPCLKGLKRLVVGQNLMSSSVLFAISTMSRLEIVELKYPSVLETPEFRFEKFVVSNSYCHAGMGPLSGGAFGSLTSLGLFADVKEIINLFRDSYAPSLLQHLKIETTLPPICADVMDLLDVLASKCHEVIRSLYLDFNAWSFLRNYAALERDETWSTLEIDSGIIPHLQKMRNLQSFHISCRYPLKWTDEDVLQFVSTFPGLHELSLCPSPASLHKPPFLSQKVLPIIATHCPNIRVIKLYLLADTLQTPDVVPAYTKLLPISEPNSVTPTAHHPFSSTSFAQLRILDFGSSMIQGEPDSRLVGFLSSLLPESCKIICGWPSTMKKLAPSSTLNLIHHNAKGWEDVQKLVNIAANLKKYYAEQNNHAMSALLQRVNTLERALSSERGDQVGCDEL